MLFSDYNALSHIRGISFGIMLAWDDSLELNFLKNIATIGGGATYYNQDYGYLFNGNASVSFTNNAARTDGTIFCNDNCTILDQWSST